MQLFSYHCRAGIRRVFTHKTKITMKKHYFKHIICAVITMLCLPMSVGAQTSQTTHFSQSFPLGDHDVVKAYNETTAIASAIYEGYGATKFFYNVAGRTVRTSLLRMTNVFDFVIDNDTVFYCGVDNFDNAIVGFFNIQDLFFNGGQFYYSNSFHINNGGHTNTANSFNKLVTYRDTVGKRHVVCVGKVKDMDNTYPCIVDMISDPLLGFTSYHVGIVNDITLSNSMREIQRFCTAPRPAQTDMTQDYPPCDYLVVTGVDTTQEPCLRLFNAQEPFAATGPQHTLYFTYQSQLQYVLFGNCRNSGSYQYNVELETSGVTSECMPHFRGVFTELSPLIVRSINSEVIVSGNRLNLGTIPAPVEIHEVESDCSY